jgi:hypothetical protein
MWREEAACSKETREMQERFFSNDIIEQDSAKHVCFVCPVILECLEFSLGTRQIHFIYGMHNEKDRKRLIRWLKGEDDPFVIVERSFERMCREVGLDSVEIPA